MVRQLNVEEADKTEEPVMKVPEVLPKIPESIPARKCAVLCLVSYIDISSVCPAQLAGPIVTLLFLSVSESATPYHTCVSLHCCYGHHKGCRVFRKVQRIPTQHS